MLRILVVGPAPASTLSRGGMATVTALMVGHPDARFRITVVPTFVDGTARQRLWVGVRGMIAATWLVLFGRVDVVHIHLSHRGSVIRKALPLLAARLSRTASVVHGHSYNFGGWFDQLAHPLQRVVRWVLLADHWLVLGNRQAEEYAARLRLPVDRISVLRNAVRIPRDVMSQAGANPVHAVSLGRLGVRKGSYDLVAAVGELAPDIRRRLKVTMAGDGDVAAVSAAVDAAGLSDTVRVVGWLDPANRDEVLSAAHIFVLPSYDEGLPIALLEAMAHGLAPVTTAVGSIGEVISDGVDGLIVPAGRPPELANCLSALVCDEALRTKLGAAARNRATDFGVDRWYEQLATLWIGLVDGRVSRHREC